MTKLKAKGFLIMIKVIDTKENIKNGKKKEKELYIIIMVIE